VRFRDDRSICGTSRVTKRGANGVVLKVLKVLRVLKVLVLKVLRVLKVLG
jgi:hypothetical protein